MATSDRECKATPGYQLDVTGSAIPVSGALSAGDPSRTSDAAGLRRCDGDDRVKVSKAPQINLILATPVRVKVTREK